MTCVKPNLIDGRMNAEKLDIPALEWAARGRWEEAGCDVYEFIGKYDALIALGCAQLDMLAVGRSGKKSGPDYETQRLADDRFRVELRTNDLDIDAVMERAKTMSPDTLPAPIQHDPMSLCLQKAATLVERYPPKLREQLYKGLFDSEGNGWQLVESFPWLAVRIFTDDANESRRLVRHGAKMRDIADAVGIPMCFKRFHPKATFYVAELSGFLCRHPDVVSHHCPKGINPQSSWLSIIAKARESGNEDFAIWTAIHCEALGKHGAHWIRKALEDLNDWIKACASERASCSVEDGAVKKIHTAMLSTCGAEAAESLQQWWQGLSNATEAGRPFNKEMSPETVLKLSEEWHERAAVTEAADVEFPEPWYEGGKVGDYQIEPIKTAPELSRYAFRLHNCATSYAHDVARGKCFLYVVLQDGIPKAMVELKRDDKHASLSQLSGPCNEHVGEELETAVNTWFVAAKIINGPRMTPVYARQ